MTNRNEPKTGVLAKAGTPGFALLILLGLLGGPFGWAQGFFPLKDIHPGLHGVGRTVFQGNRVEEFQVEILGVIEDEAPQQSIILGRRSGGPLAETGILQGMSGSPVYIDGKLAGVVALGFPFSKEPIAGIQPIEQMIAGARFSETGTRERAGPAISPAGIGGGSAVAAGQPKSAALPVRIHVSRALKVCSRVCQSRLCAGTGGVGG